MTVVGSMQRRGLRNHFERVEGINSNDINFSPNLSPPRRVVNLGYRHQPENQAQFSARPPPVQLLLELEIGYAGHFATGAFSQVDHSKREPTR